jgi:hypothetical protein
MTSQVFSIAEDCSVQGRGPDSYIFSQTVAEIVREAGFDGMVIPGTRGASGERYSNVVIFDPLQDERWRSWVKDGEQPYVLNSIQRAGDRGTADASAPG